MSKSESSRFHQDSSSKTFSVLEDEQAVLAKEDRDEEGSSQEQKIEMESIQKICEAMGSEATYREIEEAFKSGKLAYSNKELYLPYASEEGDTWGSINNRSDFSQYLIDAIHQDVETERIHSVIKTVLSDLHSRIQS